MSCLLTVKTVILSAIFCLEQENAGTGEERNALTRFRKATCESHMILLIAILEGIRVAGEAKSNLRRAKSNFQGGWEEKPL